MTLSNSQRRYLRGLTHDQHPIVTVADNGLSENVRAEIEQALEHHELVKIKLRGAREERSEWAEIIARDFGAELVHQIGQVACYYRRHPKKPRIALPG